MPSYTLLSPVQIEINIRKSRFIAYVENAQDRQQAHQTIQRLREEHPHASHICWALLAQGQSGMSDDGEPSGTAGRPIMEVLRHHQLDHVLGVVIRYFGGIKLGSGGLIRAYSEAISQALHQAQRVENFSYIHWLIEISYADEAKIRRWCTQESVAILECYHDHLVKMLLKLPQSIENTAQKTLSELTKGKIEITKNQNNILSE